MKCRERQLVELQTKLSLVRDIVAGLQPVGTTVTVDKMTELRDLAGSLVNGIWSELTIEDES